MPEIPPKAAQAAAEVLYREYDSEYGAEHLSWRDFEDQALKILKAAVPFFVEQTSSPAQPRRQRLSRTRVERIVRETQTRPAVHFVGDTGTLEDGRRRVFVHFLDRFADVADSPAAVQFMSALQDDGWSVVHERGRASSRLVVSEPEEG